MKTESQKTEQELKTKWRLVGKIKEPHGLKGEVFVLIFSLDSSSFKKMDPSLLGLLKVKKELNSKSSLAETGPGPQAKNKGETLIESSALDFFNVEKYRLHKKGFVLKLKELQDRNDSELWKGALVYLSQELFAANIQEPDFRLDEILGFTVLDEEMELGPIVDFSSNGPQDLLVVEYKKTQILIPFVEVFIKEIRSDLKQVKMTLPKGLIEIYEKKEKQN